MSTHRYTADEARAFLESFPGRRDCYGADGARCAKEPLTPAIALKHLSGEQRLGVYMVRAEDNTGRLGCLDFDSPVYPNGLTPLDCARNLRRVGVPFLLERSKAKGWHFWFRWATWTPAAEIRGWLARIAVDLMGSRNGPEVFPKSGTVPEGGYGNFVNLPLFDGGRDGKTALCAYDFLHSLDPTPLDGLAALADWVAVDEATCWIEARDLSIFETWWSERRPECSARSTQAPPTMIPVRPPREDYARDGSLLPCATACLTRGVDAGMRDKTLFRLAVHMRHAGWSKEQALAELTLFDERNRPPMGAQVIATKIASAFRGRYGSLGCEEVFQPLNLCDDDCPLRKRPNPPTTPDEAALPPPPPPDPRDLGDVHRAFRAYLCLEDTSFIDVAAATVLVNRSALEPLWVLLVGPSSSGKTEALRALADIPWVLAVSAVTAKTFASGVDGRHAGLLKRLEDMGHATLVLKDLTTLLNLHPNVRAEVFAQLREIYDGEFVKVFGSGKEVKWRGKMGLLAGVTGSIEHFAGAINEFGDRYVWYRLPAPGRAAVALAAIDSADHDTVSRAATREALYGLLAALDPDAVPAVSCEPAQRETIAVAADVSAWVRTNVPRDGYRRDVVRYDPELEGPARMAKQLFNLARGLAVVRGRDYLTEEDLTTTMAAAFGSAPRKRMRLLKLMYGLTADDWLSPSAGAKMLRHPRSSMVELLDDLTLIGALDRRDDRRPGMRSAAEGPYYRLDRGLREKLARLGVLGPPAQASQENAHSPDQIALPE